jgi:prepilin-type N-terminal cleavage/methylation domain-containing protein
MEMGRIIHQLQPILPNGDNYMKQHTHNGFTLIEMLVSIGIVGLLSIVIVQAFFSTTQANTKVEITKDVKQNGDFAIGVIERALHGAQGVQACSSSVLSLNNTDGSITTFSAVADGANGVTRVTKNLTEYLTGTGVTVATAANSCAGVAAAGNFQFTCAYQSGDQTQFAVTIKFCLTQKGLPGTSYEKASQYFSTTVNNRN